MEHEWMCGRCGMWMQASDAETLAWGIGTHSQACAEEHPPLQAPRPFGELMRGMSDRDALEERVICWLVGMYGRPFIWFREGAMPLVVT